VSCEGKPVELQDLRTAGQKEAMEKLGGYLTPSIGQTRDPYPGTLSAPYDPGQLAAMNTMMGMGGYAGYDNPQMSLGPGARVGPAGPAGSADRKMGIPGVAGTANAANVNADANPARAPMGPSGPVEVNVSPTPFISIVSPGPIRPNVFAGPVPGPADSSPFVGPVTNVYGPVAGGFPSGGDPGDVQVGIRVYPGGRVVPSIGKRV